jgi:hypothetical protein
MRPEPINPEKREEVIVHMAAGLLGEYQYFGEHRKVSANAHRSEPRRNAPKVGRNDLCPCGSGRSTSSQHENTLSIFLMIRSAQCTAAAAIARSSGLAKPQ